MIKSLEETFDENSEFFKLAKEHLIKALEKEKNENKSLREELEKYRKQGIVIS